VLHKRGEGGGGCLFDEKQKHRLSLKERGEGGNFRGGDFCLRKRAAIRTDEGGGGGKRLRFRGGGSSLLWMTEKRETDPLTERRKREKGLTNLATRRVVGSDYSLTVRVEGRRRRGGEPTTAFQRRNVLALVPRRKSGTTPPPRGRGVTKTVKKTGEEDAHRRRGRVPVQLGEESASPAEGGNGEHIGFYSLHYLGGSERAGFAGREGGKS